MKGKLTDLVSLPFQNRGLDMLREQLVECEYEPSFSDP